MKFFSTDKISANRLFQKIPKGKTFSDCLRDTSFVNFLYIATFGIFIFSIYTILILCDPISVMRVNMFLTADDRYMDFFNLVFAAKELDVYARCREASSPFFLLICHIVNKTIPAISADQYGVRHLLLGKTVYGIYMLISLAFFAVAFNKLFNKFRVAVKERFWFYLVFLFSYPVLLAFDRGNYAFLTAGIIALSLIMYASGKNIAAAVILGIAISLKYYYAPFAVLFLIDRKWTAFIVSTVTAGLILCCSLAFFEGGFLVNAKLLSGNILYYNSEGHATVAETLGHNTSVYMLFDIPYAIINNILVKGCNSLVLFNGKISMIANLLLLFILVLSACVKRTHDRILLVTAGILLFPFHSLEYIIPVIFLPAAFWMLNEPKDRIMPCLLGLYVICKRYYSFYDFGVYVSVTIQSILNPLLLLIIIAYIIWLRRVELNELVKTITVSAKFSINNRTTNRH